MFVSGTMGTSHSAYSKYWARNYVGYYIFLKKNPIRFPFVNKIMDVGISDIYFHFWSFGNAIYDYPVSILQNIQFPSLFFGFSVFEHPEISQKKQRILD